MRGKLAGLVGIFAVALALGLGVSAEQDDQAYGATTGYSILAENKGPNAPLPAPGV
ncbi:hypothetical protein ABZX75_23595 [Streptomyces sp. NPDC003038]|uniref:hypothetical protein n=1 Tax=unclassified Streptomyces TaxID=2593676 RepID=UPI0033B07D2A